jgi:hypothetical protein
MDARHPWDQKQSAVAWRGSLATDKSGARDRLVKACRNGDRVNVGFTSESTLSPEEMMGYRGIFSVDGHANEWDGLFWKLTSSSVVLMVESSRYYQWYYHRLEAWVHFIPIQNDLFDLQDRIDFVLDPANDEVLQDIAKAATDLVLSLKYNREVKSTSEHIFNAYQDHVI